MVYLSKSTSSEWNGAAIRKLVQLKDDRRFDIKTMPADMQRVYKSLASEFGEEYGLLVMFTIRTAVELHRAWHMTLLTSKILQQLKEHFRLRLTWDLSVFKMQFRLQDGGHELYRKVPYDYDSEYQDIYYRIAVALMDGDINVHEALIYQSETKMGQHTAASGRFLRDFPGRLILYPLVAATCAVIFFSGDWKDFGVAALCGFASGLVEWGLSVLGAGILTDTLVGTTTGIIGGLFYRFNGRNVCLSAIFLGNLYWYFYGTAFVIGILEIISGELQVGVTRFIAVSVKTFVLCLGAGFGLLVVGNATEAWYEQSDNCGKIDLDDKWWRIPLYLLCSCAVLGQYRFPVVRYWRALLVMLVGYVVQYEFFDFFANINDRDNLDTATSNVFGSAASVVSACIISFWVNRLRYYHDGRILQREEDISCFGNFIDKTMTFGVYLGHLVGLGRKSDRAKLVLSKKISESKKNNQEIKLDAAEENLIIETIVGSQDMNIWSILMPALYQLVPGSMIAKLWFNYIFPPPLIETEETIPGTNFVYKTYSINEAANNVFAGLMIISTSLALGLIVGFAIVHVAEMTFGSFSFARDKLKTDEQQQRAKNRRTGMYSSPGSKDDDPDSVAEEFRKAILHGVSTADEADMIFNTIDIDQSNTIDQEEVTDYMLKAGMRNDQIQQLFASMDKDGNGEVSREEFRRALLDKKNAALLTPQEEPVEESPVEENPDTNDQEEAVAETGDQVAGKIETGVISLGP